MSYGSWANQNGIFGLGLVSGWNPTAAERAQQEALGNLNSLGGNSLNQNHTGSAMTEEEWQAAMAANAANQASGASQNQTSRANSNAQQAEWAQNLTYDQFLQGAQASGANMSAIGRQVNQQAFEAAQAQGPEALQQYLASAAPESLDQATRAAILSGGGTRPAGGAAEGFARSGRTAGAGDLASQGLGQSYEEYLQSFRDDWREAGLEIEDPNLQTLLGRPEMADAASDPRYAQSFDSALSGMEDIYRQGGYTEAERAQMRMAQQDAANFGQSQLEGQLQALSARGMTGSGIEAMMRGASSQSAANSAARSADQITANGMDRALSAMQQSGAMASSGRAQSFGEDSARRSAIDNFNMQNTQYQQGVQQRNVDRRYTAAGAQMNQANIGMGQEDAEQARTAGTVGAIASGIAGIYTGGASTAATAAAGAANKSKAKPYGTGSY